MSEWRKAIPESRDRLQSKLLVWCVTPLLAAACVWTPALRYNSGTVTSKPLFILFVSLTFGIIVWALRAATPGAAICGSMICFIITASSSFTDRSPIRSGLAPLLALFILTFLATRAGRRRKAYLGLAEPRRNAAQVIANLGMAAMVCLICTFNVFEKLNYSDGFNPFGYSMSILPVLLLAPLCEATADTVSSEIGQAFGGTPIMLTSFRRVSPGTDGAVSLLGTGAGIAAATLIALIALWSMRLEWWEFFMGLTGGIAGLFFDSLLGATLERKGWLGNDLVNFSSTLFAALVALTLLLLTHS